MSYHPPVFKKNDRNEKIRAWTDEQDPDLSPELRKQGLVTTKVTLPTQECTP